MITPQDIADRFNAAGLNSPEKIDALLANAGNLIERQRRSYALQAAQTARTVTQTGQDAAVAAAQKALDDADAAIAAGQAIPPMPA